MKRLLLAFLFCFVFTITKSQITAPEQDCFYAINVCNEILQFPQGYVGNGFIRDIPDGSSCMINEENSSVWLRLEIDSPGQIVFDITPLSADDYDFSVYNITNSSCQAIADSFLFPVRCSYYGYNPQENINDSITGLRYGRTLTTAGAEDSAFLAPLDVLAGEVYAIIVDNFITNGSGFKIDFSQSTAKINSSDVDTLLIQAEVQAFCRTDMESGLSSSKNEILIYFNAPVNTNQFSIGDFSISGPSNIGISNISYFPNSIKLDINGFFIYDSVYTINILDNTIDTLSSSSAGCSITYAVNYSDSLSFIVNSETLSSLGISDSSFTISEIGSTSQRNDFRIDFDEFIIIQGLYNVVVGNSVYQPYFAKTNPIYINQPGPVDVCFYFNYNCYRDTFCKTIIVDSSVNVIEKEISAIANIYPNPANDKLVVSLFQNDTDYTLQLFDAVGKLVFENTSNEKNMFINTSNFTNGIYYLVLDNGERYYDKISIVR